MRRAARRRGVALPAALGALAVLAALATAGLLAARAALRGAYGPAAVTRARAAAEGAIARELAGWDGSRALTMAPGDVDSAASGDGSAVARVARLAPRGFLLDAEARDDGRDERAARRRVWVFARLGYLAAAIGGALTSAGAVEVLDGAEVSGRDEDPPAPNECDLVGRRGADTAAVAAPHADSVRARPGATVAGGVRATPGAADPATYERLGGESFDQLARRARVLVGPEAAPSPRAEGSSCVAGADAWGEPRRGAGAVAPCVAAAPVVLARAPGLTVRGPARGQGTLLVDGDLRVVGDVEFSGVVVVRGALDAAEGALRVRGAVLVANASGRGATVLGPGSRVAYSSCAVAGALLAASRLTPIRRRSWAEVTR